jgi:hypothetical protein
VVVEQEVAVEDAVWAVVAAAVAVVAVEEDVVAEASDQPTIKTRTKNNHCLERPRLESEIVLDQTEGQIAIHTINCIPNSREQDITKGRPYQRSEDSLCRRNRPGEYRQKENLINKEFSNQCISKVAASFLLL